ncbi:MAG: SUF system Fe-S cluster assembly protein [Bacteroidota bacterium]
MSEQNALELESKVLDVLKNIYDPEIPVNIYDLGLIYEIHVDEDKIAHIKMTLTAPNCPVAESLPAEIEAKAKAIEGIKKADVEITFDPPWDKSMISDEAKLELGLL